VDMGKRYFNMTMRELISLKEKKLKQIHKLLSSGLSKDKKEAVNLDSHIAQINAEIASRVAQLPLWK